MSDNPPQYYYASQHAGQRLFDRYGVISNRAVWRDAFLDVVEHRSVLLARDEDGTERHIVKMDGVAVVLLYKPSRAKFVSALPANYRYFKQGHFR